MNKSLAISFVAIFFAACSGGPSKPEAKPYKFNRDALDKMVKENKAIYDVSKRRDGSLETEIFYLGDTAKYKIDYDEKSNIRMVVRFDSHGQAQWQESYHPNGQRKSHYALKAFEDIGPQSVYHGMFETYYPNGIMESTGEYTKRELRWILEFDKEGYPGDTTIYEYIAPKAEENQKPDSVQKPKIEKINTATTPN